MIVAAWSCEEAVMTERTVDFFVPFVVSQLLMQKLCSHFVNNHIFGARDREQSSRMA